MIEGMEYAGEGIYYHDVQEDLRRRILSLMMGGEPQFGVKLPGTMLSALSVDHSPDVVVSQIGSVKEFLVLHILCVKL